MRKIWSTHIAEIKDLDLSGNITMAEAKLLQSELAEATINTALAVTRDELETRTQAGSAKGGDEKMQPERGPEGFALAVLALGKLGAAGLDYGSDLDLVIVYDDSSRASAGLTNTEYYSRAVEIFVNVLSSVTRDGTLYRVDLRLRPYGTKGLPAISEDVFLRYMAESAAIWEMLAFVNMRSVGGYAPLGSRVEQALRRIIQERSAALDPSEIAHETRRVRLALEKQHRLPGRGAEVDIKYGAGGMLDIYFAVRYLQLLGHASAHPSDRSTQSLLQLLAADPSLAAYHPSLAPLGNGYRFLSSLDHALRLIVGRTTRLPAAGHTALNEIAARMNLDSPATLIEHLTLHRLAIREAFHAILGTDEPPSAA
jgi:glutamate-ammonia-ligase adenylyltransferase